MFILAYFTAFCESCPPVFQKYTFCILGCLRPQHPARITPAAVDVVLSIMDSASILKVIINIFNPF